MGKVKNNQVALQGVNQLAALDESNSISNDIETQDMMIPRIYLMQALSDFVDQEKAKAGDLVNSLDEEVIGSREETPFEFIVLGHFKTYLRYKMIEGKWEFDATEEWRPQHEALCNIYEEEVNGMMFCHNRVLNFYVLSVNEVEENDAIPIVLSCKRTSAKAAKKLNTLLKKQEMLGNCCYAKTFLLTSKKEEGDKGAYYVLDVKKGRMTNEHEINTAAKWFATLKNSKFKIHDIEGE